MQTTIAAIYVRLSSDDLNREISRSITNQIDGLKEYAKNNHISIFDIYIDDGYSGGSFDRPGFQALIKDMNLKRFNTIIIKDLSRLGRNLLSVGNYIENVFPLNNIRLISVSDNYDSERDKINEEVILRSLLNDYYLKECKKKAKQAILKRRDKKYMSTGGIYGYKYDQNKNVIIDEEPAKIVKYIFEEYSKGTRVKDILSFLNNNHIPTPGYQAMLNYNNNRFRVKPSTEYTWTRAMITRITSNIEYTGVALNQQKIIKNGKQIINHNPVLLENKIPVIITKELYQKAQKIRHDKTPTVLADIENIRLKGLLFCSCCNKVMTFKRNYKDINNSIYVCGNCKMKVNSSTIHKVLESDARNVLKTYENNPKELQKNEIERLRKTINYDNYKFTMEAKKKNDLDIERLFEAKFAGKITDTQYKSKIEVLNKTSKQLEDILFQFDNIKIKEKEIISNFQSFKKSISTLEETNPLDLIKKVMTHVNITKDSNQELTIKIKYSFSF